MKKTDFYAVFLLGGFGVFAVPAVLSAQDYSMAGTDFESAVAAASESNDDFDSPLNRFAFFRQMNSGSVAWDGFVNAGYYGNAHGATGNGNVNCGGRSGAAFNGAYLRAKKETAAGDSVDWGFGADLIFGEDSRFMRTVSGWDQSWVTGHDGRGNGSYGFSMPQLFGEIGWRDWKVTAGHFYTSLGYELIPSSDRFFHSTGLSFDSLPATHTGAKIGYGGWEKLDLSVGWVNGRNEGFSMENGGNLVLGSATWKIADPFSLTYAFVAGRFRNDRNGFGEDGSIHTWVFNASPMEKLNAVTTVDYQNLELSGDNGRIRAVTVGQHLYWTFSDRWKGGGRVEWQQVNYSTANRNDDHALGVTLGARWTPLGETLVLRPEIRYDNHSPSLYGDQFDKKDQLCLGFDALWKF